MLMVVGEPPVWVVRLGRVRPGHHRRLRLNQHVAPSGLRRLAVSGSAPHWDRCPAVHASLHLGHLVAQPSDCLAAWLCLGGSLLDRDVEGAHQRPVHAALGFDVGVVLPEDVPGLVGDDSLGGICGGPFGGLGSQVVPWRIGGVLEGHCWLGQRAYGPLLLSLALSHTVCGGGVVPPRVNGCRASWDLTNCAVERVAGRLEGLCGILQPLVHSDCVVCDLVQRILRQHNAAGATADGIR
mmetsp:Transcript_50903/g.103479  ORF Transcript_50903/g.103479 Transcript_50903/m.103479 type:complete len:239 (-) Transcript_50903:97-813(-)